MAPDVPNLAPALDASGLLSFPLEVSVSPSLLVVLFALVVAFWAVMTVIYLYHWRRFPFGLAVLRWTERVYLGFSFVVIALLVGSVFAL